ncbi:MAG: agmatine deiminase family protein [Proteobacteria bacterium]|nr:agmatine deiminase family protein [Pseudomonadota bacterium]MCP4920818.1 agmatine deiminase family protein [Pseudomonadota bacterium]
MTTRRTTLKSLFALPFLGCVPPVQSTDPSPDDPEAEPGTPREAGFRLPAEWEDHESCLMAFPTAATGLTSRQLERYRAEWIEISHAIAAFEPVLVIAHPDEVDEATAAAPTGSEIVPIAINDIWMRDTGPLVLVDDAGNRAAANFGFNGWGEKYPYADDAAMKAILCDHLGLDRWVADMVLEGGAISQDGTGRCITTERCLLHEDRGSLTKEQIATFLSDFLAIDEIIWLPDGLVPDPITDGHVDGIAQFIGPNTAAVHTIDDERDDNFEICAAAVEILEAAGVEVVQVPLDSWTISHLNFYLANGACIVPIAGKENEDRRPLAALAEAMPDRELVPIESGQLAQLGGGIHCITQQLPS